MSPDWITDATRRPLELALEARLFTALASVDAEINRHHALFDAVDSFEFLSRLARDALGERDKARLPELLTLLGETKEGLAELWLAFIDAGSSVIPERYRSLLQQVSVLAADSTPVSARTLDWKLLSAKGGLPSAQPAAVGFVIDASIRSTLGFEITPTVSPLPRGLELRPTATRIGLGGSVAANAKVTVPISVGAFSASAAAQGAAQLSFYTPAKGEVPWAAAIARSLREVVNPFELEQVRAADGLDLIRFEAHGSLSFGAELGIAQGFEIAKGATAKAALTYGVTARHEGAFEYCIYRPAGTQGVVRVTVKRRSVNGLTSTLGVTVTIDATGLATSVKQTVDDHLGDYRKLVGKVEGFTLPSKLIGDEVKAAIANLAGGNGYIKTLVEQKLGLTVGPDTVDTFVDRLLGHLDLADVWSGDAQAAGLQIAQRVLRGLPADLAGEQYLVTELALALAVPVTALRDKLKQRVTELLANAAELQQLDGLLDRVNEQVSNLGATLDERVNAYTARLMRILGRYQTLVQKFASVLEKASTEKISLALTNSALVERGEGVEFEVDFLASATATDAVRADAALAYRELLTGSAERVITLANNGSPLIAIGEGTFTRFHHLRKETAFSIVLMDIDLAGVSILDANTEITVNARGEISVLSKLSREARRKAFGESQELVFVSAYRLAAAGKSIDKSLEISLALSKKDDSLKEAELRAFLHGLEAVRLIGMGATDSAVTAFRTTKAKDAKGVKAELNLSFKLETGEVLNLLAIAQPDGTLAQNGTSAARTADVRQIVLQKILDSYDVFEGNYVSTFENTHEKWLESFAPGESSLAARVLSLPGRGNGLEQRKGQLLGAINHGHWSMAEKREAKDALDRVTEWRARVSDLEGVLELLKTIYFAPTSWTEADYNERQMEIGEFLVKWLDVKSKALILVGDDIRHYTLAFIGAIQQLADVPNDSRAAPTVVVTMAVDGTEVFRVG